MLARRPCTIDDMIGMGLETGLNGLSQTSIATLPLNDLGRALGFILLYRPLPSRLTDEELAMMQDHPRLGLKIIEGIDLFKPAVPYIIAHHERYDGQGYPNGLKGEEIPIEGRLLTVADTIDAILSNRPYRDGASLEVAMRELINNRGTQFDPHLVDVAIEIICTGKVDLEAMYGHPFNLEALRSIVSSGKVPV